MGNDYLEEKDPLADMILKNSKNKEKEDEERKDVSVYANLICKIGNEIRKR